MTAKRAKTRQLASPACGALAIVLSITSMRLSDLSFDRVAHDWWALASIGGITLGVIALVAAAYSYWRRVPQRSRQARVITVTLGVTVPLVLVCTLARVVAHTDVDLGSLPAWISAGGALFTAGGVLLALHSYRATRREDLEDQASQVRLLRVSALPCGIEDGKQQWQTEFANRSDKPLYALTIHGFRAQVVKGAPAVLMRPIEKIHLEDDPRRKNPLTFAGSPWHPEIAAGARVRTTWAADENVDTSAPPPAHYTAIWYSDPSRDFRRAPLKGG